MSLKKQAIQGTKWTTISTILNGIVQIARIAILTRFLDKSDYGLIALVTLVTGFTGLFADLGIPVALMHKLNIDKKEFSSVFWFNILLNFLLYLILIGLTPLASHFYNQPILNILIPIMGIDLIITSLGKLYSTIIQKNLYFKSLAIINLSGSFLALASAVIMAYYKFGVYSLVYSTLISSIYINCCFIVLGYPILPITLYSKFSLVQSFLKIGLYQTGTQILDYISNQLDIFLIGKIFGVEWLGIYNLAKQLIIRPYFVINSIITSVAFPIFAKIQNDLLRLKSTYLKIISSLTFINMFVYSFLAAFSADIVSILYGKKFSDLAPFVTILCVWGLGASIGNPAGILTIAKGRTDLNFRWTIIRTIINPIIIIIASHFSIIAVAYSQAVLMIGFYFLYWKFLVNKVIDISFAEYFNAIKFTLLVGLSCFIIFYFLSHIVALKNSFYNISLWGTTFFLTYFLSSYLFNKKIVFLIKTTFADKSNI